MAVVGQIVVGMKVQTDQLKQGLNKAGKEVKGFGDQFGLGGLTSAIPGLGQLATVAGVAMLAYEGLAAAVRNVGEQIEAVDKIYKLADRMNTTTEAVIGLQYAFGKLDVDAEEVGTVLAKTERAVSEAASGSAEAKEVFTRLGLDLQKLSTMKPDEQFKAIAEGLSKVSNQADRAAIEMKLFKETGNKLDPLFREGAAGIEAYLKKAQELGLVVTNEQAQAIADMKDKWEDVSDRVTGMWRQLTVAIAPALEMLLDTLKELLPTGEQWADLCWVAGEYLKFQATTITKMVQGFMVIFKIVQGLLNFLIAGGAKLLGFREFGNDLAERAKTSMKEAGEYANKFVDFSEKGREAIKRTKNETSKWSESLQASQQFLEKLRNDIATFGMSPRQKELYDAQQKGLSGPALQQARAMIWQLEQMEAYKKAQEEATKAAEEHHKKMLDVAKSARETTPYGKYTEEIQKYMDALRGGYITQQEFLNAQQKLWGEMVQGITGAKDKLQEFGETLDKLLANRQLLTGRQFANGMAGAKDAFGIVAAPDEVMRRHKDRVADLQKAWRSGAISAEEYALSVQKALKDSFGLDPSKREQLQNYFKQMQSLINAKASPDQMKQAAKKFMPPELANLWEQTKKPLEQYQEKIKELMEWQQAGADPALIARGIEQAKKDLGLGQPQYADIATMGSQQAYTDYLSTMYGTPEKNTDKDIKDIATNSKDQREFQRQMVGYLQKLADIEYADVPF
jgi:hypothetical protein